MSEHDQRKEPTSRQVVGGSFEEELRRGQAEDGGAGSVEPELAVVHLLRHAGGVQALSGEELDSVWRDISGAITPRPWYRRPFVWLSVPALAAGAAVVALAVLPADRSGAEADTSAAAPIATLGQTIEDQFALLEAPARAALSGRVDARRSDLRRSLLNSVVAAHDEDGAAGGAP